MLVAVWRGIPSSYKSRYRRDIWQQFEDNIRSAAYTNNLGKFIDSLCLNLNIKIRGADVELINGILQESDDKALLKLIREETTLLVLMVRLWNQERREEWEALRTEREIEEQESLRLDFGLPIEETKEEDIMKGLKRNTEGELEFEYDEKGMLPAEISADIEDFLRSHPDMREQDFLAELAKQEKEIE